MARVRLFHWKAEEAKELIGRLRASGHEVAYDEKIPGLLQKIKKEMPELIVISLRRLPSHGREVATFLRGSKATRHIPIVFVDGEPEKVEGLRQLLPDAGYTSFAKLGPAIRKAMANRPETPVVPVQMMDRYGGRTTAQKMGIVAGATVGLLDPPRDYENALGAMPDGVTFQEGAAKNCAVMLWFVTDADAYASRLPLVRALAARTKLWIVWQKGRKDTGIGETYLRETANALGLVDYKICSVNERWSAMAFAQRKA